MLIEQRLEEIFRNAGWKVEASRQADDRGYDLKVHRSNYAYLVVLKTSSEGRRDRLIPLMAQAILQAKHATAAHPGLHALAVVGASRIPQAIARDVVAFATLHAPKVSAGVVDLQGLSIFMGPGLHTFDQAPESKLADQTLPSPTHLFSDLNQWMLKVLLARLLDDPDRLSAPISDYPNVSTLAERAKVSVMSAFRFVRQLEREGFIHENRVALRLVRIEELLRRWQAASERPARELAARWAVAGEPRTKLRHALKAGGESCCLGLFAAARELGVGVVNNAPLHLLVHDLHPDVISKMGLAPADPPQTPDVVLRIPTARQSVVRGLVRRDFKCCDVLQAWLDVSAHPVRGREQADHIYRKILEPMLLRAKHDD